MSVLELRAVRGWSVQQTADAFLVTEATISSWMKRVVVQSAICVVAGDTNLPCPGIIKGDRRIY
jgi:DNA-directed RNA polymerase specialized sigma24 family protein